MLVEFKFYFLFDALKLEKDMQHYEKWEELWK
jgi:hypothetical protein